MENVVEEARLRVHVPSAGGVGAGVGSESVQVPSSFRKNV